MIVDLPAPVGPTIARVFPLWTENDTLFKVRLSCSLLYLNETFLNDISPQTFVISIAFGAFLIFWALAPNLNVLKVS